MQLFKHGKANALSCLLIARNEEVIWHFAQTVKTLNFGKKTTLSSAAACRTALALKCENEGLKYKSAAYLINNCFSKVHTTQ